MSSITTYQAGQSDLELAPRDVAVLLAPFVGTAPLLGLEDPTNGGLLASALTPFISTGNFTKKDGVKLSNSPTINEIKSTGKGSPTRLLASEAVKSITYVPQQLTQLNVAAYWGAVNSAFTAPSTKGGITVAIPELPANLQYRAIMLAVDDYNGQDVFVYWIANKVQISKRTDMGVMDSNVFEHGVDLVFLNDAAVGVPVIFGVCGQGWQTLNGTNNSGFYPALTGITVAPTSQTLTVSAGASHTAQLVVTDSNSIVRTTSATYVSSDATKATVTSGGLITGAGVTAAPVSDVQTVSVGAATAGTFTLAFNGQVTGPIAFNAVATTVQSALTALSTIGAGNVAVTGTGPWVVTFQGALANAPESVIVANGTALTGGAASVVHTTTGVAPVKVTASLQGQTAAVTLTVTP